MALNSISFDEQYYLQQNPDVASAVSKGLFASGEAHFNAFGRFEQRDPNQFFDTSFYLGQYPDVAASKLNPFQHFLSFGAKEGRFFNANELATIDTDNNGAANEFDVTKYLTANPDVDAAIKSGALSSAYQHFVLFGQFEGRTAFLNNGTVVSGPLANGGTGGGTNTGTTFTLTDKIDAGAAFTGTAGNDTFIGDANTVSAADQLNGGAGVDTLNFFGAGATPALPSLTSVEIVNFTAPTANITADVSANTGVTTIGLTNSAVDSTFTVNAAQNVSYTGVTAGAQTVVTTAADTEITATLSGSKVASLDVTGAGITTINLAATGTTASTITGALASSGTETTVNITGTQALTIGTALDASVKTVNASANAGGVTVTLGASDATVTGGSGADKFIFANTLTTADTVVGGAGVDTISVVGDNYSAVVANGTLAALNTKVTGFEVLEFTGAPAATTINGTTFTNTEITKILFNTTAGTDTVDAAGSARTYAFGEINTGAATLNGTAGVTSFNVALEGIGAVDGNAANGANVTTLLANFTNAGATQVGTGTINISSTGANGDVNSITSIDGNSNTNTDLTSTKVVITGSHDLTIGSFTSSASVDASAFTGKLVIGGSAGQDLIVGGTGADTINASAGGDTYRGGAGADSFVFSNINQGSRSTLTTIGDFTVGSDKLDVSAITTAAGTFNATAVNVTAAPDFTAALNLAAAGNGGAAGLVTYFQQGGDTYVVADNGAGATFDATTDAVIKITGLVTLTATDVVA